MVDLSLAYSCFYKKDKLFSNKITNLLLLHRLIGCRPLRLYNKILRGLVKYLVSLMCSHFWSCLFQEDNALLVKTKIIVKETCKQPIKKLFLLISKASVTSCSDRSCSSRLNLPHSHLLDVADSLIFLDKF